MISEDTQDKQRSHGPALSSAENESKICDRQNENFLQSHEKPSNLSEAHNLRPLSRSSFLLVPVTLYTFLILFAWVVTCILTHRPMTGSSYGVTSDRGYRAGNSQRHRFIVNESWYTAVRFIQAGVAVLTLPLTTTVCSYAAVVYLQHMSSRSEPSLNLRQMTSLSDRSWTDLTLYTKLLTNPSKNWKRYGCRFLAFAILLHILGGIISPIQQIYLSSTSVKTPTAPYQMSELGDITRIFAGRDNLVERWNYRSNRIALVTRKAIESVSPKGFPSGLWSGSNLTCVAEGDTRSINWDTSNATFKEFCSQPGLTWSNISALPSPFMSQLPRDFNTGLIRQLAPRYNSTSSYENITAAEFPSSCAAQNGSLSFEYSNSTDTRNGTALWALQACMPAESWSSTSKATRDRQDFTEELFLNVTLNSAMQHGIRIMGLDLVPDQPESEYFRIKVRTTAGYFELPNYMNGQIAGPLLDKMPPDFCGNDCIEQFYDDGELLDSEAVEERRSGPLSDTAIALFGEGSFLANQAKAPEIYVTDNKDVLWTDCVDLVPFGLLLPTSSYLQNISSVISSRTYRCAKGGSSEGVALEIGEYLSSFRNDLQSIEYAFTVAAYLANRAWLEDSKQVDPLIISYDLGQDSQRPSISTKGVIILSTLLGVFLILLWVATIYAIMLPRWTEKLDSFTMMRLGASIHEKVPLRLAGNYENIPVLDETPGWIGDSTGHEKFGHIALGGPAELKAKKHFDCYYRPGVEKRRELRAKQMDRGL